MAGHPEWASDPRFETNPGRLSHHEELERLIDQAVCTHPVDWWVEELGAAGVAVAPVNTTDRVFADPQVVASGIVRELDDPRLGRIRAVATPLRFDGRPLDVSGGIPLLGESNREVLGGD